MAEKKTCVNLWPLYSSWRNPHHFSFSKLTDFHHPHSMFFIGLPVAHAGSRGIFSRTPAQILGFGALRCLLVRGCVILFWFWQAFFKKSQMCQMFLFSLVRNVRKTTNPKIWAGVLEKIPLAVGPCLQAMIWSLSSIVKKSSAEMNARHYRLCHQNWKFFSRENSLPSNYEPLYSETCPKNLYRISFLSVWKRAE